MKPASYSLILFSCIKQLLLMKRGGQVIYAGSLGHQSHRLVEYFEVRTWFEKLLVNYHIFKN